MRTGPEYLAALKDDREIYIDGERVRDVASHPAFTGITRTIAALYDYAADPANGMIYTAPQTGREANRVFMIPCSRDDLAARREAITAWAELTHGFVGRSPDHVGAFLAAFAAAPKVFTREQRDFSANVTAFYRRLLAESLYVSYAIIPPQYSRATTAHGWEGDFVQVGVVEEREDGIVVRGSQMLGTGATVSDEVLVSCIKPLAADDKDFAVTFVLPVATPGLKFYCRRPYAPGQPSTFDYPLSTRFDESDALLVFDDVFVPWERVFVDRDVAGLRAQFFDTGAHVLGNSQAQIRLVTKLKFLLGVARKITQVNGIDRFPQVQESLGELASMAALLEGAVLAAEYASTVDERGVCRPAARYVYGAMGQQAELYPRVLHIIRELVGGGVLQVPSSFKELTNPQTRADMDRYVQSPGTPSQERIKLFKLAWDIVGSEFAGRHHQYEMFYAGAPFVAKGYAFRGYDYTEPLAVVESFLSSYSIESAA
ncbi:4-hydroxyphenylacetate 3-hydroxylase N-terminal domain-containing protein [Micromonospora sp. NPDC047707]|uniref:4-hydroxyphenylacetate 3-hydroxylase family protein n=1 Tax=Micromonospora sp. NPDC047707 TaxID=3154498 RepID=UPI00345255B6